MHVKTIEKACLDSMPFVEFTSHPSGIKTRIFKPVTYGPDKAPLYEICVPKGKAYLLTAIEAHETRIENGDGKWERWLGPEGISYTHPDFDAVYDLAWELRAADMEIETIKNQCSLAAKARAGG